MFVLRSGDWALQEKRAVGPNRWGGVRHPAGDGDTVLPLPPSDGNTVLPIRCTGEVGR